MDSFVDRAFQIFFTNYKSPTGYHGRINFLYEAMMLTNVEQIRSMVDFIDKYGLSTTPRLIYRKRDTGDLYIQTDSTTKIIVENLSQYFTLNGVAIIDGLDMPVLMEHQRGLHEVLNLGKDTVVRGLSVAKITKPFLHRQSVPYSAADPQLKGQFRISYDLARGALLARLMNTVTPE